MRRPGARHDWYLIQTYAAHGEPSSSRVRARPVAGQGLPLTMKVECSRRMRREFPVGTVFRVKAQVVENANGTCFLHTHSDWLFEVVRNDGVQGQPARAETAETWA